jgi:hypothetical protein
VHFTETDLAKIGVDAAFPLDADYKLTRDLDLSVVADDYEEEIGGWTPIGEYYDINNALVGDPFSGQFDGNGKTIRNLALAQYDTPRIGLFGIVEGADGKHAVIKNLTIELDENHTDLDLTLTTESGHVVGVVCGRALYADFEKITIQGDGRIKIRNALDSGKSYNFGVIIGYAGDVNITDCHAELDIVAENTGTTSMPLSTSIGGLVGNGLSSTITGSSYNGDITVKNNMTYTGIGANTDTNVGGLSGIQGGINGSYATGNITVTTSGNAYVGGLKGQEGGATDSYFIGNITVKAGNNAYAGGILGLAKTAVSSCWTSSYQGGGITSIVTSTNGVAANAGGIVGQTSQIISNCYSTMENITANSAGTTANSVANAGGIAGQTSSEMSYNYSAVKKITAEGAYSYVRAGGIMGFGAINNNQKNKSLGNVVFRGIIEIIYADSSTPAVQRISAVNGINATSQSKNIASEAVVLKKNSEQVYPNGSQVLSQMQDGVTKTPAQLQAQELFFGTADGQLGWDTTKWKWDNTNKSPKLAWEN